MDKIVRVFQVTVSPGMAEEFTRFFTEVAVPLMRDQDGLISLQVGLPTADAPLSFLMVTTWTTLEALQRFAGEDWSKPVIDPREAHMIDEVDVHHYIGWGPGTIPQ